MVDLFPVPNNKKKYKPNINPEKIAGSNRKKSRVKLQRSNITGKDNLISIKKRDNPSRQETGMGKGLFENIMSTFATERTEKSIRKDLQLLRNTLVGDFKIAKLLKSNSTIGVAAIGAVSAFALPLLLQGLGEDDEKNEDKKNENENIEEEITDIENNIKSNEKELNQITDSKDDITSDSQNVFKSVFNNVNKTFESFIKSFSNLEKDLSNTQIDQSDSEEDQANSLDSITNVFQELSNNLTNMSSESSTTFGGMDFGSIMSKIKELESNNDYGAISQRNISGFSGANADVSGMTIDQVDQFQTEYLNFQKEQGIKPGDRSAAVGAYQMMDVKAIAESMGMDTSKTIFDKKTQDKMFEYFLNLAGLQDFKEGNITAEEFNNNLAKYFATIQKTSGKGVYDKDGFHNAKGNILEMIKNLKPETSDLQTSLNNLVPENLSKKLMNTNFNSDMFTAKGNTNFIPINLPSKSGKIISNMNGGRSQISGPTQIFWPSSNSDTSDLAVKSIFNLLTDD